MTTCSCCGSCPQGQGAGRLDALKQQPAGQLLAVLLDSRVVQVAPIASTAATSNGSPREITIPISPRENDLPRIREKIKARWPQ
jgi:hypothetical protein